MTSESALRHIPEDTLEQYCMGHLSESEVEPVEEHLLMCNLCQDAYAETADFLIVVRSATEQLQTEPQPQAWWQRWWQSATTLPKPVWAMAACALALFVILPNRNAGPTVVDLQTMRGPESAVQVPANATLELRLALPEAGAAEPLQLRLADAAGAVIHTGSANLKEGHAEARVEGLKPGSYWARLYSNEELVQEYAINVR
jgi:predicted anti-sigma-YlaC factor YlaD